MGLLRDEERQTAAGALKTYKVQAKQAINRVIAIKTQLNEFKAALAADINGAALYYTTDDTDDAQSIIDYITSEVAKI